MDEIVTNRIDSIKVKDDINWQDATTITCNVEFTLKGSRNVIKRELKINVNIRPVPGKAEIIKVIQNADNYKYPEINQAQLSYGNKISTMYLSQIFSLDWN